MLPRPNSDPSYERPRERLGRLGPRALTAEELLAVLLGTGSRGLPVNEAARALLSEYGTLRELARAPLAELARARGVGRAKAARLVAALELGSRRVREDRPPPNTISSAADVFEHFATRLRDQVQESFYVVMVSSKGGLQGEREVTRGLLDVSLVHPREVFGPAIRESAASILLVHNHPSGDPTPSEDDIVITRRLAQAGDLLGIPVLDHIVIGDGRYVSLAETGFFRAPLGALNSRGGCAPPSHGRHEVREANLPPAAPLFKSRSWGSRGSAAPSP